MQNYKNLERHFGDVTALKQIDAILDWDRSVMMPAAGMAQRAQQTAVLNVKIHDMMTDARLPEWMNAAANEDLDGWQKANLRQMQRHVLHATAVPADLISRKLAQETRTEMVWREARAKSDFSIVRPELEKMMALVREYAQARASAMNVPLYDALMDHYVPGMTSAEVDVIFEDLAGFLPPLLDKVLGRQQEPLPLQGPFSLPQQIEASRVTMEALGFGGDWGRLDTSAHPFSTGIGGDVRITARYKDHDFINALQAVTHEAGHGFYDRNTPSQWNMQPVGASQNMGMAIHESQSLGLEMQMGRSRGYWEHLGPRLAAIFGGTGPAWSGENLYRHATKVGRGFIRFEADEITYPSHVILRYRLEKKMVEGSLAVKDLPEAWNAQMQALIGVTPPDDAQGCLQDIHWHMGAVGYFPAYALGAVVAAQFSDKMKRDIPDLDARIARGEFSAFVAWQSENIHRHACLYSPQDLIKRVTGETLSARFLKAHLEERYAG